MCIERERVFALHIKRARVPTSKWWSHQRGTRSPIIKCASHLHEGMKRREQWVRHTDKSWWAKRHPSPAPSGESQHSASGVTIGFGPLPLWSRSISALPAGHLDVHWRMDAFQSSPTRAHIYHREISVTSLSAERKYSWWRGALVFGVLLHCALSFAREKLSWNLKWYFEYKNHIIVRFLNQLCDKCNN